MKSFPFITAHQSQVLLRVSTAFIFLTHAIVRLFNGTIPRFGGYLDGKGLLIGTPLVWAITAFEIMGGLLLALGYYSKWLSAGFVVILVVGILLIHASARWFVGEHGSGGSEYSFILIITLIVIAATYKGKK